jgi:hypothetical protein
VIDGLWKEINAAPHLPLTPRQQHSHRRVSAASTRVSARQCRGTFTQPQCRFPKIIVCCVEVTSESFRPLNGQVFFFGLTINMDVSYAEFIQILFMLSLAFTSWIPERSGGPSCISLEIFYFCLAPCVSSRDTKIVCHFAGVVRSMATALLPRATMAQPSSYSLLSTCGLLSSLSSWLTVSTSTKCRSRCLP